MRKEEKQKLPRREGVEVPKSACRCKTERWRWMPQRDYSVSTVCLSPGMFACLCCFYVFVCLSVPPWRIWEKVSGRCAVQQCLGGNHRQKWKWFVVMSCHVRTCLPPRQPAASLFFFLFPFSFFFFFFSPFLAKGEPLVPFHLHIGHAKIR